MSREPVLGLLCRDLRSLGPVCPAGSRCPVNVLHHCIPPLFAPSSQGFRTLRMNLAIPGLKGTLFQPEAARYGSSLQKRMNNCGSNMNVGKSGVCIPFIGFQVCQFSLPLLNGVLIGANNRSRQRPIAPPASSLAVLELRRQGLYASLQQSGFFARFIYHCALAFLTVTRNLASPTSGIF